MASVASYVALIIHLCVSQPINNNPILVQTESGLIEGTITEKVRMFRSIPYAQPPVNNLRWAPPQYVKAWGNNTVHATSDPPGCPQICILPPKTCPIIISEDCLYLNIYAPSNISSTQLPVLIFVHGGNFKQGYSGGLLYNATDFVNYTNIIVVTINYRLGTLGFLWSNKVGMEGNYGLLDQKMAFKWIHTNIKYFGGDNSKITLFGQSAGAISTALHMTQTDADSAALFQSAILESEPFGVPIRDTRTWGELPKVFFNAIGCEYNEVKHKQQFWSCLRNRSIDEILSAQATCEKDVTVELLHEMDLFMPWSPTVATDLFPMQPIQSFQSGKIRDIPFMIGSVANEATLFIYQAYPKGMSRQKVMETFAMLLGPENAIKVREHYPEPQNTTDYRAYVSRIATDGLFKCPIRNITAQHLESKFNFTSTVYMYHFNHASSFNEMEWNTNYTFCWGDVVCHGEELTYVFHPDLAVINSSYTKEEDELSLSMQAYWTQFAKIGSPGNGGHLNPLHSIPNATSNWQPFALESENSLQFQVNQVGMQSYVDVNESKCDFWDSLNYDWIK